MTLNAYTPARTHRNIEQIVCLGTDSHGTLDWTHACGPGKGVAHIVSGMQPEVDFALVGFKRLAQRLGDMATA